jgi:hypothetical protein
MAYFQNVFTADFQGSLVIGDRQHSPTFKCRGNFGRGDAFVVAWKEPTYNLSGNDGSGTSRANLTLSFAIDVGVFKNWSDITVNVTQNCNLDGSGNPTLPAVSTSAVTATEIMTSLNADATFSGKFTASLKSSPFSSGSPRLQITQNMPVERCKFYIKNGAAEDAIGFNARAGIDQLPDFFNRHTIANRWFVDGPTTNAVPNVDGQNMLIKLAPTGINVGNFNVDALLINYAVDNNGKSLGYNPTVALKNWELLRGRAGYFMFTKNTVDANTPPRITDTIQYPAGAKVGDFAKKITYVYTGTNAAPDQITEYPYVLTSSDLLTPSGTGQ